MRIVFWDEVVFVPCGLVRPWRESRESKCQKSRRDLGRKPTVEQETYWPEWPPRRSFTFGASSSTAQKVIILMVIAQESNAAVVHMPVTLCVFWNSELHSNAESIACLPDHCSAASLLALPAQAIFLMITCFSFCRFQRKKNERGRERGNLAPCHSLAGSFTHSKNFFYLLVMTHLAGSPLLNHSTIWFPGHATEP